MENPQHVLLGLVNSHMDVPKGARLHDGCPKCGEKPSKFLYNNNNTRYQVRVQCLRTDCKHKYQLFAFRKLHPDGYKKVKITESEQYVGRVKVCPGCGRSDVKFYGLNNNDAIQARYKCLNLVCKKLFTPFGNSCKKKRNYQELTTVDSHVVDNLECIQRTSMNDLQYSTSNDQSPVTHVVNPSVFTQRAYWDAVPDYSGVGGRPERLKSWNNPYHGFRYVPTTKLQDDDQVNYGLLSHTTWDLKSRDPAMAFMPVLTVWKFQDYMSTVVAPNPTPTTWQEDSVYVLPTQTDLLQQEDQLVHDVLTTPTSFHEDHKPTC